jgi:hypothetical protein
MTIVSHVCRVMHSLTRSLIPRHIRQNNRLSQNHEVDFCFSAKLKTSNNSKSPPNSRKSPSHEWRPRSGSILAVAP